VEYNKEEMAALESWKKEEMAKLDRRSNEMSKLKSERDAQLKDQARRRADQAATKQMEEGEARKLLALEHKRKLQEEANNKVKIAAEMAALVQMNDLALKMAEEKKVADAAEEKKYQQQYADKLKKQEEAYHANLAAMKEKQKAAETAGAAIGEYKRWMDEKIIERNFAEREAMLDKAEEEAIKKVHEGNMEMRRVIAEQVKEKKERLAKEKMNENSRYHKFTKVLSSLDTMEKAQMMEEKHQALQWKAELEAQMRDNLVRKQVFPMTATERALNADLINNVEISNDKN